MFKNRKNPAGMQINVNHDGGPQGLTQLEPMEFEASVLGSQQRKKKIANVSAKRAEQNRIAQRNFREKQMQKQRDMLSQLEQFDQLKAENEIIKLELNALKAGKENMIHLMDKLRSENIYLYDIKAAAEKKYKRIMESKTHVAPTSAVYQSQPVVKGNFGLITRPPPPYATKNRITIPSWTSHKNTFVDSATSSNSMNHDTVSVSSSIEKDSNHTSQSIEIALPPSNSNTTNHDRSSSSQSYPTDNYNYPGYPSWTPPTLIWTNPAAKKQNSPTKERVKAREMIDREKRLPPNPLPYHLSFSYTDTKTSHNTHKPLDYNHSSVSGQHIDLNMQNSLKNEGNDVANFPTDVFEKPATSIFEDNANYNAFSSLFSSEATPQSIIPLKPPQLFDANSTFGNLIGPQQAMSFEETRPMWMPFLPSTNAMVPLYHHIPFESLGSSTVVSIPQDNFNNESDNLFFSSQQNLSFGPLHMHGSVSQNTTLIDQLIDPANFEKNDRLKDVFLPI